MEILSKAFLLGAGLGTRLRPLTEHLPKPLVPLWNRPLITYAMDHLIHDLGIDEFAINTHHCPEAYQSAFPEGHYANHSILFRHEPILLDTGGGIDNLRDWLPKNEPFLVYNADILTDLPLSPVVEEHLRCGNLLTMALRSTGSELRVGYDSDSGRIVDLRGELRPDWPDRCQFTGIYVVSPAFLRWLAKGKIESVVYPILRAIRAGEKVGGVIVDSGAWYDLGTRSSYLDALTLLRADFPSYPVATGETRSRISPLAEIHPEASLDLLSSVGAGAVIERRAIVRESVIWPGGTVAAGANLTRTVIRNGKIGSGEAQDVDF